MSTRALVLATTGLALSLALGACSAPAFTPQPVDGGGLDGGVPNPTDNGVTNPKDRPAPPGDAPIATNDQTTVDPDTGTTTDPDAGGNTDDDVGQPVDVGNVMPGTVPASIARALPEFNAATVARVRAIRTAGIARGNRVNVFTKIGDSITEAAGFLQDYGNMYETDYGRYPWLSATVAYFITVNFADGNNSFNHPSMSAMGGWTSDQPLLGDPSSPLRAELAYTRPLYGVVMIGTNDLASGTLTTYMANLTRIVTIMEDNGTVPVVSTIPDRPEEARYAPLVTSFNNAIRALTASRNIPLIDYWVVMHDLPSQGIDTADGIHPSIYRNMGDPQANQLTDAALQYGYNMRNLTALLMFDRLRNLAQ